MTNPLLRETYKISAHRLNMFTSCRYKLYLYLLGIVPSERDTTYINAGLAVHYYLEKACICTDYSPPTEGRLQNLFEDFNITKPEMQDRVRKCIPKGLAILNAFPAYRKRPEEIILKAFDTPKGRHVTIDARLDLIVEGKHIIDYKTGMQVNKPEYTLQMHVYRFVTDFVMPASCISLLSGERLTVDSGNPDYIPMLCDKYIDVIESNDFERADDNTCRFCEYYKEFCSEENRYVDPRTKIKIEEDGNDGKTVEE